MAAKPKAKIWRWRRWFILATILLCSYFFLPMILNFLASLLIRQNALQPADIVVALGGGTPCLRQDYAAVLYRQGLARKLLISGLPVVWGAEAEKTVRQHFTRLGVPPADLVFTDDTGNTRVEVETFAQLMRARGWKSAIVVTDQFHTRRAVYSCERAAPDLTFYAAPLPDRISLWKHTRWWTRRGDMWLTVREFFAWGNTLVGGLR